LKEANSSDNTTYKVTVFHQYTRQGDLIQDSEEDSPSKRKIDELMGRINTGDGKRGSLGGEHKTVSAGVGISLMTARGRPSGRDDKILVSNAESRAMMESIVSAGSSRQSPQNDTRLLDSSGIYRFRPQKLPDAPKNRFENHLKDLKRRQARE